MDKIIIESGGIFFEEWNEKIRERVIGKIDHTSPDIFRCWTRPVEVREGFTLGDLVKMLNEMDEGTMVCFEMLTNSNVSRFIKNLVPVIPEEDGCGVHTIEVFKYIEVTDRPAEKTHDIMLGCHGIGNKWKDGGGESYAIEFTDWQEMLNLPIKLNLTATMSTIKYVKGKPKKMAFFDKNGNIDGEPWDLGDEEYNSRDRTEVKIGFTFAEFFEGLFDELCFFSDPVNRDEKHAELIERCEDYDKEDYFEMKTITEDEPQT